MKANSQFHVARVDSDCSCVWWQGVDGHCAVFSPRYMYHYLCEEDVIYLCITDDVSASFFHVQFHVWEWFMVIPMAI